jgi:hypothetical protein
MRRSTEEWSLPSRVMNSSTTARSAVGDSNVGDIRMGTVFPQYRWPVRCRWAIPITTFGARRLPAWTT